MKISRRRFIKTVAVAGGLTVFPQIFVRSAEPDGAPEGPIHPNIDDMRVIGITDPAMVNGSETGTTWARQNEMVVKDTVWSNIDKLAMKLAECSKPEDAWRKIFVLPQGKTWQSVTVAIKTNNIADQHTRGPVLSKICHTLVDVMKIKPSNIHVYDGCHGRDMAQKTPFSGLPAGCVQEGNWGGINTPAKVKSNLTVSTGRANCVKHFVDGTVDILINIAMCKGHSPEFGGVTMTMKNHFGTFTPQPGGHGNLDYLLAINKTQEILGPRDKTTGKVICPRQQLCLVDALWASREGPGGLPSAQPNFIAMGTFGPAVDYQLASRFRDNVMGWKPNYSALSRFLSDFGRSESDFPEGGKLIEA